MYVPLDLSLEKALHFAFKAHVYRLLIIFRIKAVVSSSRYIFLFCEAVDKMICTLRQV
jgi:hypothetical protein